MIVVKPTQIEEKLRNALRQRKLHDAVLISVDDIHKTFGIGKETINKLSREGKLVAITFGEAKNSAQRFMTDDVINYIVQSTIKNKENKNL